MAKIVKLLEKMGLVYSREGQQEPTPAAETSASEPAPADVGPRPGGPPTQLTPPAPPVKLDVAALEQQPSGEDYALEQIYTSAGIVAPEHGFTVDRLIEMLEAEEFRGMDAPTRARVITGMLKRLPTGAVEVDDIVRDAEARDRALDAFEGFLADRLARHAAEIEEKNRALQQEIDELTVANTEKMDANRASLDGEKARFERWRARKRAEEERLFAAVQPFVERNPVTVAPEEQEERVKGRGER
jgi:DNA-binding transcriptional MerR regulator